MMNELTNWVYDNYGHVTDYMENLMDWFWIVAFKVIQTDFWQKDPIYCLDFLKRELKLELEKSLRWDGFNVI